MGQAKRTIIVKAVDGKGQPQFSMAGFGVTGTDIHCSKSDARPKMKKSARHHITFELANESSLDLRFPKSADEAIWVAADDKHCPQSKCSNPEIEPKSVSHDGECLTVENLNNCEGRLKFSLVFEDSKSGERHIFDPIWINKNGGLE